MGSETMLKILATLLCGVVIVSCACRVHKMDRLTRELIFWQHAVLGVCAVGASVMIWFWTPAQALACFAIGVALFMLAGAPRWWHGAPPDTHKPRPLTEAEMSHVNGGTKD